ncbi:SDR family oxidoreductase [Flavobacteriaceae bacterium]|nr:SDR family oxidoreductase [Flavobacteriaceae bacterium]
MSKVVVITGASSGLGRATAQHLSEQGHRVFGTCRNPSQHQATAGFEMLPLEITDTTSIQSLVQCVREKAQRIDVLINNAGVGITGPQEEITMEAIHQHFKTNCYGPLELIQAVLPHMRQQKTGLIINITSIAADMGLPFRGPYAAAKSALERMSEALRMEVKAFRIEICNLAPGDFVSNIAQGRHHAPLLEDSPYYEPYKTSLEMMNAHVEQGIDPKAIVAKIEAIMEQKNPEVRYKVGAPLQKISGVLKVLLPSRWFEKLLMNHYKL